MPTPFDEIQLECEWFEACVNTYAGMAPHPDKGVIPVCRPHVDLFRIPLINTPEGE